MKKFFLVSLALFLFPFSSMTIASASEICINGANESSVEKKAASIKIWFKGVPPKKYNGKTRVTYYKNQGGYIGVYV